MARRDPLSKISTTSTPQTQPLLGAANQVRNDAGGYVFGKDVYRKVEDFLILGSADGTFYAGQDKVATSNVEWLIDAIRADGIRVVNIIRDVSTSKPPRAPKNRPAVFALAMVFAFGDPDAVSAAKMAFNSVVRTTDHLSMFFGYAKQLHGKASPQGTSLRTGRALRSALGSWFYSGDPDQVAHKACKARQRQTTTGERLELRDVLRVAHPQWDTYPRRALIGWLAENGSVTDEEAREHLKTVDNFLAAQAVTSEAEALQVVQDRKVPWEFLPSKFTSSGKVWEALAPHVGATALLRNLARMTRNGAITPFSATTEVVVKRLGDAKGLARARIHPTDLYLAMRIYNSGFSQPDEHREPKTWEPVAEISDALAEAYDNSFAHVEASGVRLLLAIDSSGSMSIGGNQWVRHYGHLGSMYRSYGMGVTLGGTPIGSPYEVANAMAVITKRIEGKNAHVIDVDTGVHTSRLTARTNLREIATWDPSGGGTDLAAPFTYATARKLVVDGFVIYSDMETWAGRRHASQALDAYRAQVNPDAKVVAVAMTPRGITIANPDDPGVLQAAGMDASLPKVIAEFMRPEPPPF